MTPEERAEARARVRAFFAEIDGPLSADTPPPRPDRGITPGFGAPKLVMDVLIGIVVVALGLVGFRLASSSPAADGSVDPGPIASVTPSLTPDPEPSEAVTALLPPPSGTNSSTGPLATPPSYPQTQTSTLDPPVASGQPPRWDPTPPTKSTSTPPPTTVPPTTVPPTTPPPTTTSPPPTTSGPDRFLIAA